MTTKYMPDGAISLTEAARRIGKHGNQVRNLIGYDLQAFWIGNKLWIVESSVATYLEKVRGQENGTAEKSE